MPITRDQATGLTEVLLAVRDELGEHAPRWTQRQTMLALGELRAHPAALEVIAWAAIRCARDPLVHSPHVIPMNGPHWDLGQRPREPRLTPDLECPKHVGKWAGNCPECRAWNLAKPEPEPTPDESWAPEHVDRDTLLQHARSAIRDAQDEAHAADDQPAEPEPNPEPSLPAADDPCPSCGRSLERHVAASSCAQPDAHPDVAPGGYGTPEHARAHHDRYPNRVGKSPDQRRRMAAATAQAQAEARRTGQVCDETGCRWPFEEHAHPVLEEEP